MENILRVKNTDGSSYPIVFANDFEILTEQILSEHGVPDRICITADSNTAPLFLSNVKEKLSEASPKVYTYIFPAGEKNKTWQCLTGLLDELLKHGFTRESLLIALGGGVTGDMTGFAAAIYMRGISFVEIPTTLLSQVDASIGGKTAVDYHEYKNMIGAFHMPALVYISASTLHSLPDREYAGGLAEVLKAALILDEPFYGWILDHMDDINERKPDIVGNMIFKSCRLKKQVVEKDPLEAGERMLLNFGHTIGHALEKALNFEKTHGECVSLGCLAAMKISYDRGYLNEEELYEFRDCCVGYGLPIHVDGIDVQNVLELTKYDKKMYDGQIRFVLLRHIGEGFVSSDVTDAELISGIEFIKGDKS